MWRMHGTYSVAEIFTNSSGSRKWNVKVDRREKSCAKIFDRVSE